MLLKVVRENEVTYYDAGQIRKLTISPVYGRDDLYDVALNVDNSSEIVKVVETFDDAEDFVRRLYEKIQDGPTEEIVDLSTF